MVQLQHVVLALTPFVLIALFHHMYYTTHALPDAVAYRAKLRVARTVARAFVVPVAAPPAVQQASTGVGGVEAVSSAAVSSSSGRTGADAPRVNPSSAAVSSSIGRTGPDSPSASKLHERPGMFVYNRLLRSTPVGGGPSGPSSFTPENGWKEFDDYAKRYPPPTLSAKRLLDGSANYLPVPDAESDDPSDLRWRKAITPGAPCPAGRRPFHVLLTAQVQMAFSAYIYIYIYTYIHIYIYIYIYI